MRKDTIDNYFSVLFPMAVVIAVGYFGTAVIGRDARITALEDRIDSAELALAAKTPAKIKFYTIPGYDCDDSEIKGHCTKWNMSMAEYDKKNSHLFKVTR